MALITPAAALATFSTHQRLVATRMCVEGAGNGETTVYRPVQIHGLV